jgi:hypothetical protein
MLLQHHYVVSFKSWTKIEFRIGNCDLLNLTVFYCSKISKLPLYHMYFLLRINHITHSHQNPPHKLNIDDDCHYNCS